MWRFFLFTLLFSTVSLADTPPSPERQKYLQNLLKNDCGACHGLTLKGGLGPSLLAQALAEKKDDFLINTILEGRPGTAMPPWKTFLNRKEAAWLVQQLR